MKTHLRLEELFQFILAFILFVNTGLTWWLFFAWLLAPDISMLGYLGGTRLGAVCYNIAHSKILAVLSYAIGLYLGNLALVGAGLVLFGHSSMDRSIGYGLKYNDHFAHTHLGWIGKNKVS